LIYFFTGVDLQPSASFLCFLLCLQLGSAALLLKAKLLLVLLLQVQLALMLLRSLALLLCQPRRFLLGPQLLLTLLPQLSLLPFGLLPPQLGLLHVNSGALSEPWRSSRASYIVVLATKYSQCGPAHRAEPAPSLPAAFSAPPLRDKQSTALSAARRYTWRWQHY